MIITYPSLTLFIVGIPVVLMLPFAYVFGGTLGAGLGDWAAALGGLAASDSDRAAYLAYVVPGILLIRVAGAGHRTAALRGLPLGAPIGSSGWLAAAWCVGVAALGLIWALRLYERLPVRVGG